MTEDDFMLSMILQSNVYSETIDSETSKLSNDQFEVYLKKDKVVLVIDKRNPNKKSMYNDIKTAYDKIFG